VLFLARLLLIFLQGGLMARTGLSMLQPCSGPWRQISSRTCSLAGADVMYVGPGGILQMGFSHAAASNGVSAA
jgi:hypothetical protein